MPAFWANWLRRFSAFSRLIRATSNCFSNCSRADPAASILLSICQEMNSWMCVLTISRVRVGSVELKERLMMVVSRSGSTSMLLV